MASRSDRASMAIRYQERTLIIRPDGRLLKPCVMATDAGLWDHEFLYQFLYHSLRFGEKNQVALSTNPPISLPLATKLNPPHIAV